MPQDTQTTIVEIEKHASQFIESFDSIQRLVHENAKNKGFWDSFRKRPHLRALFDSQRLNDDEKRELSAALDRNEGEACMLQVTEIAEGYEGYRKGNGASDHIPDFSCQEEEQADNIIRGMDLSGGRGYRLARAIIAKILFNLGRPYMHGKNC